MEMDTRVYFLNSEKSCWEMLPEVRIQYKKVMNKQLEEWQKGNPLHSDKIADQFGPEYRLPEGIEYECCPDFSCCCKINEFKQDQKDAFIRFNEEGNTEATHQMLMGSLFSINESTEQKVHLAGFHGENKEIS